jgi:hypothetical protein
MTSPFKENFITDPPLVGYIFYLVPGQETHSSLDCIAQLEYRFPLGSGSTEIQYTDPG